MILPRKDFIMNSNICYNCGAFCERINGQLHCRDCGAVMRANVSPKEYKALVSASRFLYESNFDQAKKAFEDVLQKHGESAEAYWGRFRARYHISCVTTIEGRFVPSCPTKSGINVFEDVDFFKAMQLASEEQKTFLKTQADYIKTACSPSGASKNIVNRFTFGEVDPNDAFAIKPKRIPVVPKKIPFKRLLSPKMRILYTALALLILLAVGWWNGVISVYHQDGFRLRSNGNGTFDVVGSGFCRDTEIEIPSEYLGMPVTGIADSAFSSCSNLTSVVIPEGVTRIGTGAFYNCNEMTSIVIPESMTSIGSSAFSECDSLTSVNLPEGLTSIDNSAFYNCESLTSIDFPASLVTFGKSVFEGCNRLGEISVHEDNAYYCSEDGVLFNKEKTELLYYPHAKASGQYAIPEGVTYAGYQGFRCRAYLRTVLIPESIDHITYCMFQGCVNLQTVVIPSGVTVITEGAFDGCASLTDIRFNGTVEQWKAIRRDPDWDSDTGDYLIYCTDGIVFKSGFVTLY